MSAALAAQPLAHAVVQGQGALDPYAPALLLALLLTAAAGLWHRWTRPAPVPPASALAWPRPAPRAPWAVVLWLLLALALGWLWLALQVHGTPSAWVQRLDATASAAAQALMSPGLRRVALAASTVGDVLWLTPLTAIVALGLWWRRQRFVAVVWVGAVAGNSLAVRVLKNLFERARPPHDAALITSGHSFPSGHAAGSMLVYGLALALVLRRWPGGQLLGPGWRGALLGLGSLWIGAIAASRVLLGVHYASDVLAGLWWAALMLALALAVVGQDERWQFGVKMASGHSPHAF